MRNLFRSFSIHGGILSRKHEFVHAVDGVSLDIYEGETIGLVGESGCGKTTLGRTILRLIEPTKGEIYFRNQNITKLRGKELRKLRVHMQLVFQDPFSSLDPTMTTKHIISEALEIHKMAKGQELEKRIVELLEAVGLSEDHLNRYPHEFSGGQRQRIGIARSLATNPNFIVLDEPTSALDVSVQAQILNLLKDLQKNLGLTYLVISHNLSSVKHLSNRILIMYLGRIVEMGETEEVFEKPLHPYTQALISSIPTLLGYDGVWRRERILLTGDVPSAINPPEGCRFNPRCRHARPLCRQKSVELVEVSSNHFVACPFWDDLTASKS